MAAEKYTKVHLGEMAVEEYRMEPAEQVAACAVKMMLMGMQEYAARELLGTVINPIVLTLSRTPEYIRTQIEASELAVLIDMALDNAVSLMDAESPAKANMGLLGQAKELMQMLSGEDMTENPSEGFLDYIVDCFRVIKYK